MHQSSILSYTRVRKRKSDWNDQDNRSNNSCIINHNYTQFPLTQQIEWKEDSSSILSRQPQPIEQVRSYNDHEKVKITDYLIFTDKTILEAVKQSHSDKENQLSHNSARLFQYQRPLSFTPRNSSSLEQRVKSYRKRRVKKLLHLAAEVKEALVQVYLLPQQGSVTLSKLTDFSHDHTIQITTKKLPSNTFTSSLISAKSPLPDLALKQIDLEPPTLSNIVKVKLPPPLLSCADIPVPQQSLSTLLINSNSSPLSTLLAQAKQSSFTVKFPLSGINSTNQGDDNELKLTSKVSRLVTSFSTLSYPSISAVNSSPHPLQSSQSLQNRPPITVIHNPIATTPLPLSTPATIDIKLKSSVAPLVAIQQSSSLPPSSPQIRPILSPFDCLSSNNELIFHLYDLDHYNPSAVTLVNHSSTNPPSPLLVRLYATTVAGHTLLVHVSGFLPYLYLRLPPGWTKNQTQSLVLFFNSKLSTSKNGYQKIVSYTVIKRKSLMGFSSDFNFFLRLSVNTIAAIHSIANICAYKPIISTISDQPMELQVYEANVDLDMRFLIDSNINGCQWLRLPEKQYRYRRKEDYMSDCQLEVECQVKSITPLFASPYDHKISLCIIASIDIECIAPNASFPSAKKREDEIVVIATSLSRQGDLTPFYHHVIISATVPLESHSSQLHIHSVKNEKELLIEWRKFILLVDPDIIIGYNILEFDFPYLFARAYYHHLDDFPLIGRIPTEKAVLRANEVYPAFISIPGRVVIDIYKLLQTSHPKLDSYKLDSVSSYFLDQKKEKVDYSEIYPLYSSSHAAHHMRLVNYCNKDAALPIQLWIHLQYYSLLISLSRVTGVSLCRLSARGWTYRCWSQIIRMAKKEGYLAPFINVNEKVNPVIKIESKRSESEDEEEEEEKDQTSSRSVNYQGATVIQPHTGYYQRPIVTLDFSSLYPSIIIAHNLSFETWINPQFPVPSPIDRDKKEGGEEFIPFSSQKGILPLILESLLTKRKEIKLRMKSESDSHVLEVLNAEQLALKMTSNSMYGFCGSATSYLCCLPLASTITAIGRSVLREGKKLVEEYFQGKNITQSNNSTTFNLTSYTTHSSSAITAKIIYGDTDSLLIDFGLSSTLSLPTLRAAVGLAEEACRLINSKLLSPIHIEFERIHMPLLLATKKRYTGVLFTANYLDKLLSAPNPTTPITINSSQLDVKGLELLRKNYCIYLRMLYIQTLQLLLIQQQKNAAVNNVKTALILVSRGKVAGSELILNKKITEADLNGRNTVIKQLIENINEINNNNNNKLYMPYIGDTVQYLMCKYPALNKSKKLNSYITKPYLITRNNLNNLPSNIDYSWYIQHQFKLPFIRLFEIIKIKKEEWYPVLE